MAIFPHRRSVRFNTTVVESSHGHISVAVWQIEDNIGICKFFVVVIALDGSHSIGCDDNGPFLFFLIVERILDLLQRFIFGLRAEVVKEQGAKQRHDTVHGERTGLCDQFLKHRVRLEHDEYGEMSDARSHTTEHAPDLSGKHLADHHPRHD